MFLLFYSNTEGIPYNVKKYHYADGVQIRMYEKPLYKGYTMDRDVSETKTNLTIEQLEEKHKRSIESSMNRTIQNIYGIARANIWEWFITLTINPQKLDSTDYDLVTKKASQWLKNLKKRVAPDMKYILVPELHSDGYKWHIHGLLSDCNELAFENTSIVKNGKVIYNLDNWKYGFSTATQVEHTGKVSRYITKYITKDLCELSQGRRRYWCSLNCFRMNDVLEIDFLSDSEKEDYIKDIATNIQYMKFSECVKSKQLVKYIEVMP